MTINSTIEAMTLLSAKEVELCKTPEDLLRVGKFWKKYFAELNRYIAGKRDEPPYCLDDGKTVI